jgi:hypothetical protein
MKRNKIIKKLFKKKDLFEKAKKFGIDPASSDGIDYDNFCKKVNDAETIALTRKSLVIAIGTLLISIISLLK